MVIYNATMGLNIIIVIFGIGTFWANIYLKGVSHSHCFGHHGYVNSKSGVLVALVHLGAYQ
ncbi:hypothetical protein GCM10027192_12830 [Psychrobacter pocilloporae]